MGCCVIYHERCYAQLFSCSKERCFARANYGAQGVKSKTLSKQVFSTENCYVQFGVVLGLGKAIFRALLSVHYLQFCDSRAFHLTRCSTKKCVDLGHIFVIFRNVRTQLSLRIIFSVQSGIWGNPAVNFPKPEISQKSWWWKKWMPFRRS